MPSPRKKKRKTKTGRPLEDIPLRKLVKGVKEELSERIRMSFFDKPKRD
ncbi:MAG: hypothetical protein WA738_22145 [Candidatus Angelobacter sp.]